MGKLGLVCKKYIYRKRKKVNDLLRNRKQNSNCSVDIYGWRDMFIYQLNYKRKYTCYILKSCQFIYIFVDIKK